MGSFYSRLSYSFGNEDWTTEHKALQIQPEDRVLCVTASGDRPLNLLTAELKSLVTVDANPIQNALFDLKRVALSQLPYEQYLSFIGAEPCKKRLETYSRIEKNLDPLASALWDQLPKKIEQGVLYGGSIEKVVKVISHVIHCLRGKKTKALFKIDSLDEQRLFLTKHWHTYPWKAAFQVFLHPVVTRTFIKDPGLYEHVDPNLHIGKYIYQRLHNYLNSYLAKESVLFSLIFNGKVDRDYYPPYLSEEGVDLIKHQVGKTEFHTSDLISYIQSSDKESFDCFSLSDVASYLTPSEFTQLVEGVFKAAKPGARFCIRQFLSNHQIPEHLTPHFKRNEVLEQQLHDEDRCFIYRFMTGTVEK